MRGFASHGRAVLSLLPGLSRARAKLRRSPPLLDLALEMRELEPASSVPCEPAIALPGELDRVVTFLGGAEAQVPRLLADVREEGPTLSYRLPDALLADFTVYCGQSFEVLRGGRKRPVLVGSPDEFDEAQLCATSCTETYFGHFIRDALPLELLAGRRNLTALAFKREPWLHEPGYRALVGLEPRRTSFARVRNLWVTDERALNSGWTERYRELRERVRSGSKPNGGTHIFLCRGMLGTARHLINEDELVERLHAAGFRIVSPETMQPGELAAALGSAKVVACVEGSAQQHAFIAMPAGAALLSIQPPQRFNSVGKIIADAIGARFAYAVAEPAGGGFSIDPDRVLRTLDLIG